MNMITEMVLMRPDELKLDGSHARVHPREQIEALKKSLLEFGFVLPLLIDNDNVLAKGRAILIAAQELGFERVPCVRADWFTEAQRRGFALAHDRLAEMASWDKSGVSEELLYLQENGFDITLTGFEDDDIVLEESNDAFEDDFELQLPAEPVCKRGQIWQLGRHRLMCGDATRSSDVERLMAGAKAQLLLTDPPYNVDVTGGTNVVHGIAVKHRLDGRCACSCGGQRRQIGHNGVGMENTAVFDEADVGIAALRMHLVHPLLIAVAELAECFQIFLGKIQPGVGTDCCVAAVSIETGDIIITAIAGKTILYQLADTPKSVSGLSENTGITFGSSDANGYVKALSICIAYTGFDANETLLKMSSGSALIINTNGAGGNSSIRITVCSNVAYADPSLTDVGDYRVVITKEAKIEKTISVHYLKSGEVATNTGVGSYGNFAHSVCAGNLLVGSSDITVNKLTIYDGILSSEDIAAFLSGGDI